MNTNKPIAPVVGVIAALFVVSLVVRFVVLSQSGLSGGWILYFGLPIGGIGVLILLLRLGLLNFGQSATIQGWQQHSTAQAAGPASAPPAASTSQRLHELENMRANGSISDAEYNAERARVISGV
jgi:hypothetical protein